MVVLVQKDIITAKIINLLFSIIFNFYLILKHIILIRSNEFKKKKGLIILFLFSLNNV